MEYRNKLSVDYLKQSAEKASPGPVEKSFLNEAIMLYGNRILESLGKSQDGTGRLHAIVEELDIPIGDAFIVTDPSSLPFGLKMGIQHLLDQP